MPTNLETAVSKLLHPSNSKNFSQQDRDSIQAHYPPFPMVEFLRDELTSEYADDYLTSDHTRVEKQVSENPGTTGKSTPKVSKLPSQGVNCVTCSGSANTRMRGILGIGFIRTIASKLLVKRGNKDKS